jgi:hypothetical protein
LLEGLVGFALVDGIIIELIFQVLLGPEDFGADLEQMRLSLGNRGSDVTHLRGREIQLLDDRFIAPPWIKAIRHLREQ